jgi:hypothetical protein
MGAMFLLSKPYAWQDDPDHKAIEVGAVWKAIFNSLERCMPEDWRIRLNPDDCTIIQQFDQDLGIFTDVIDLNCAVQTVFNEEFPPTNPPGHGQPGEQPGGTSPAPGVCFDMDLTVHANGFTLIPLPIAEGWTVTITNVSGAWNDGAVGFLSAWLCYQGYPFALGACETFGGYPAEPTDPLSTARHMQLIMALPDGTYTTLISGTSYDVPTGVPEGAFYLQANDSAIGDNSGDITLHLTACNVGWCKNWIGTDLGSDWTAISGRGTFDGTRWNSEVYGTEGNSLYIYKNLPAGDYEKIEIVADLSDPIPAHIRVFSGTNYTGAVLANSGSANSINSLHLTNPGSILISGNQGASTEWVSSITIRGNLSNPFGSDNC